MPAQRIILVEDDAYLARLLEHVLIDEGYAVDVAGTLLDAHALLQERGYALVIADLRLPDGDGLTFADRAAELGIKTALMSGFVHQLTPAAADRHEVMAKPVRPIELIAAVRRLIGSPTLCAT